jgi:DNA-binding SARP family transcriptional activator
MALNRLLAHQRAEGSTEAAVQVALRLLALDPLQEPVQRTLVRLYVETGRRGAALRQYQLWVEPKRVALSPEAPMARELGYNITLGYYLLIAWQAQ